jgi:hypothetical protein
MSVFHRVAASLMCAVLSCGLAAAQEKGKQPAPQQPVYVVVQTGDALSVMTKTDFEAKKKSADEDFKKAHAQWEKDKKAAEEAKKPFSTPEPKLMAPEVKGGDHQNKADADAAMAKLQKEMNDKKNPPKGGDPKKGK